LFSFVLGMDRLLDGALGIANLHQYEENLAKLGRRDDHVLLGSESCHCPTTGYAGGDINIYWDRAERYAHTILADLAAGSQGWVEWNFILDGIGGPNHLGNLCEATILAVPHRALDAAAADLPPLPEFEQHSPMGGRIKGDERTREELNALGFPAKFLDLGIAVQPMYYYMGHISRHVRPGSTAVPGLVRQSLGSGEIFRPVGSTVLGGGENDLARVGIELLLWPCEGSTRQHFRWNLNDSKHITVLGHDWLGNQTRSCVGRETDKDFLGMRFTQCKSSTAGQFDVISIAGDKDERYLVKLLNHPMKHDKLCLVIRELKNGGGSYGPLGGAQVALGDCDSESAKWKLDLEAGTASSTYFADEISDNKVCMTTGWPFLQMGAFLTPNGSSPKTVVILNEAKDSANYALKDDGAVLLTGSIPPRSIQTILLD
jgi:glucosylceramidase